MVQNWGCGYILVPVIIVWNIRGGPFAGQGGMVILEKQNYLKKMLKQNIHLTFIEKNIYSYPPPPDLQMVCP